MKLPTGDSTSRLLVWTISSAAVLALVVPGLVSTWNDASSAPPAIVGSAGGRLAEPTPELPATLASLVPAAQSEAQVVSSEPEKPAASALAAAIAASESMQIDDAGFDCMIEPSARVDVGSAETGVLESIFFDRSDLVEEGEVVAALESYAQQAHVEVAQAKASMQEELRAAEVSLALGKRRKSRADELFLGKALSLDLLDEVDTQTQLAELELEQVHRNQRVAELELRRALSNLERRTIRTPISGVVVERLKAPGEVVNEEAILTVARIDPLRVEVILPATMFGELKPGMTADVSPELPADGVFTAKVDVVDRVVDPASGTFGVRLELPNPGHSIPSGLHCRVSFVSASR